MNSLRGLVVLEMAGTVQRRCCHPQLSQPTQIRPSLQATDSGASTRAGIR